MRHVKGCDEPYVSVAESNAMFRSRVDNIHMEECIPVERLIVLNGTLNGVKVQVLKDDGCNTNVVGIDFLRSQKEKVIIEHSQKGMKENSSQILLNGTLRLGAHTYTSNWGVANCRYDVLLGMPWHVANNPGNDYKRRVVTVEDDEIPVVQIDDKTRVRVTNLGVKQFRKLLKRKKRQRNVEVFQVLIRDAEYIKGLSVPKRVSNWSSCFQDSKLSLEMIFQMDYHQKDQ